MIYFLCSSIFFFGNLHCMKDEEMHIKSSKTNRRIIYVSVAALNRNLNRLKFMFRINYSESITPLNFFYFLTIPNLVVLSKIRRNIEHFRSYGSGKS